MPSTAPFPEDPGPSLPKLRLRAEATLVVYYDEGCGPCTTTARLLDKLNWLGRVRFRQAAEHPTARGEQYVDIHATRRDGRVYRGYATYPQIAWRIPLLWPLAPFMVLWPLSWIGRSVYRRVADSRQCETPMPIGRADREEDGPS